jgi:hypothetical protein
VRPRAHGHPRSIKARAGRERSRAFNKIRTGEKRCWFFLSHVACGRFGWGALGWRGAVGSPPTAFPFRRMKYRSSRARVACAQEEPVLRTQQHKDNANDCS